MAVTKTGRAPCPGQDTELLGRWNVAPVKKEGHKCHRGGEHPGEGSPGPRVLVSASWLSSLLAVWPPEHYLASLVLSLPICEMGPVMPIFMVVV